MILMFKSGTKHRSGRTGRPQVYAYIEYGYHLLQVGSTAPVDPYAHAFQWHVDPHPGPVSTDPIARVIQSSAPGLGDLRVSQLRD